MRLNLRVQEAAKKEAEEVKRRVLQYERSADDDKPLVYPAMPVAVPPPPVQAQPVPPGQRSWYQDLEYAPTGRYTTDGNSRGRGGYRGRGRR